MSETKSYKDPECDCFKHPVGNRVKTSNIVQISQAVGCLFVEGANSVELCRETFPMLMEMCIINLAVIVATHGTHIDNGTDEALWETQRVLRGIEKRVGERLVDLHEEAKKHPDIVAKHNAMRSDR